MGFVADDQLGLMDHLVIDKFMVENHSASLARQR
jgi:hypothetical protein